MNEGCEDASARVVVSGEVLSATEVRRLQRRAPGSRTYVRFSAKVARAVCRRLATGETMASIDRDPEMPCTATVRVWARAYPRFGEALARARQAGGWADGSDRSQGVARYRPEVGQAICARISAGEALSAICADPDMPSTSTVYRWRAEEPDFAEELRLAREVQAERLCEVGWEIAQAVTPQTAYATHVKLTQLRWMTGALAPRRYGRVKAMEPVDVPKAEPAEEEQRPVIYVRRFKVVKDETGAEKVVEIEPPWTRTPEGDRETAW